MRGVLSNTGAAIDGDDVVAAAADVVGTGDVGAAVVELGAGETAVALDPSTLPLPVAATTGSSETGVPATMLVGPEGVDDPPVGPRTT